MNSWRMTKPPQSGIVGSESQFSGRRMMSKDQAGPVRSLSVPSSSSLGRVDAPRSSVRTLTRLDEVAETGFARGVRVVPPLRLAETYATTCDLLGSECDDVDEVLD